MKEGTPNLLIVLTRNLDLATRSNKKCWHPVLPVKNCIPSLRSEESSSFIGTSPNVELPLQCAGESERVRESQRESEGVRERIMVQEPQALASLTEI